MTRASALISLDAPTVVGLDAPLPGPAAFPHLKVPTRPAWNAWRAKFAGASRSVLFGLPRSCWVVADLGTLAMAVLLGTRLVTLSGEAAAVAWWHVWAALASPLVVASLVFGLYETETIASRSRIATRMLLTTICAAIATVAVGDVIQAAVSGKLIGVCVAVFMCGASLLRLAACSAVQRTQRGLLVVGSTALYRSFVAAQEEGLLPEYKLVGYVSDHEPVAAPAHAERHYLGSITGYLPNLRREQVSDIVVGAAAAMEKRVMQWLAPALRAGCRVTNEATFYEKAAGQILVDELNPHWFLFADLKTHCERSAAIKRMLDVALAATTLILSTPLWLMMAIAIKLCDGGPVFYSQERVGQNGYLFRLYKFRTMRVNAESGRSVWASARDPRVTSIGRWLRRSRLDELPQLINILLGQMSLVGPRPERPDIVTVLSEELPYYTERHLVKPGLTGWAQISFRYGASIEDAKRKLQFDLYYIKHMSFELDMIILFRTLGTFLRGGV